MACPKETTQDTKLNVDTKAPALRFVIQPAYYLTS